MAFSQSIFDKKEEFYKKFAEEFFAKEFWKLVEEKNLVGCCSLCQFYKVIKMRCDLDDKETSKIVFDSLKKKCLGNINYENFKQILDENLNKYTGFRGYFGEAKKAMNNFQALYLNWEVKMMDEGYLENY